MSTATWTTLFCLGVGGSLIWAALITPEGVALWRILSAAGIGAGLLGTGAALAALKAARRQSTAT